eukprot:gene7469-8057_t
MAVIPSLSNEEQRIPLQGKYYYQIEIYHKIYLINHERSHLYLYESGSEPFLITEGSSRTSPLTTNYDTVNALFSEITDVTGDLKGNLYISECSTNRIFKLVPSTPETSSLSHTNRPPQYTIELLATNGVDLACPYGLHYLEYEENEKGKLEEGLYFVTQQICQIRFISKKTGIIETFYTMNGPCSYDMTFLSIHTLSQTVYYLTQHPSTIHKLQLLTLPQQREGRKDLFLHERVLESDFRRRIDDVSGNDEEKGEERNRLFFIQRYLLSKLHYSIYDVPPAPPSIAPTPIMIASNYTSDLIYSSSHKVRRRLQTVSLLIDFAFAPSDVSGTPAITVANRGSLAPTVVGTLQGTPVATCLNLAWKPGYTSALSLVSTSSQYMSLNTLAFPATGMSFAFWYRCNGCASNTRVFDFGNSASTFQMIYRIDTDATVTQSSSTSTISTPSSVCNQGVWCFIVWTMTYVSSQSSQTSSHIIYLNGSQYSTASGFYPATVNRGQNYIGATNNGAGPYCTMLVGRFQLYDAVLTPTQVNNLYLNGALNSAAPTSQPSSDRPAILQLEEKEKKKIRRDTSNVRHTSLTTLPKQTLLPIDELRRINKEGGDSSNEDNEDSEENNINELIRLEKSNKEETEELLSLFPSSDEQQRGGDILKISSNDDYNNTNDDDDDDDSSDLPSFDWSFSEEDYDINDKYDVLDVEGGKKDDNDDIIFISNLFRSYHDEKDSRILVVIEEDEEKGSGDGGDIGEDEQSSHSRSDLF